MHVEQAMVISSGSGAKAICALAARSPGLADTDARELAAWGPPRDALIDESGATICLSFFPLASGAYALVQTKLVQNENRLHPDVQHHCLVASAEVLAAFGNNPFSLFTAAQAEEGFHRSQTGQATIESLELAAIHSPLVDQALLASTIGNPGVTWVGAIVQAAVTHPHVALADAADPGRAFSVVINCLPIECRLAFSFSTGLRNGDTHPWRLYCLGEAPAERYQALRNTDVAVLDMAGKPPSTLSSASGWSGFITSVVVTRRTGFLNEQLSHPRPDLKLTDLNELGDQLLESLAVASSGGSGDSPESSSGGWTVREAAQSAAEPQPAEHRSDAPHDRFQRIVAAATVLSPPMVLELPVQPADRLSRGCPQALELLERLDDLVFEAIAGKRDAMTEMRNLWPQVQAMVGPELVEESRAQYVRHAIDVWRECLQGEELRNPTLAVSAMEVLELLFASA